MKQRIICKGLAVVVIILFIGLAIQPSIAITRDGDNNPPGKPIIDGEKGVVPFVEFDYYFTTIDPDGDNVKYHIDWGDGTMNITDYYKSDETVTVGHTYSEYGTIIIKAYAEDIYGAVGPVGYYIVEWKSRASVVIPETEIDIETLGSHDYLTVEWRNRFLFMTMIIKNPLNHSVYNVNWRLELDDMDNYEILNWHVNYPTGLITGSQEILKPNSEIRIRTRVAGFGFIWNYLMVKYDDWTTITLDEVRYSLIIGPFILWLGTTP